MSPRTNTIASRDQFKPIRIGENLVVNYICDSEWALANKMVAASSRFRSVREDLHSLLVEAVPEKRQSFERLVDLY